MYDALIKRINAAIATAKNKLHPVSVHKVQISDDISELSGLIVVMHPDFKKADSQARTQ